MNLILFTMNNFNNNLSVVRSEATTRLNTQSIIDLPHSSYVNANADIQTNVFPQAYHAEVQTKSFWKLFKKSLKKFFCINNSDITPQDVRVENVINHLVPSQNIPVNEAFSQTDATFGHSLIDGVNQYFICYGDTFLSVNPDLISNFL